jgi:hypothetical protein
MNGKMSSSSSSSSPFSYPMNSAAASPIDVLRALSPNGIGGIDIVSNDIVPGLFRSARSFQLRPRFYADMRYTHWFREEIRLI